MLKLIVNISYSSSELSSLSLSEVVAIIEASAFSFDSGILISVSPACLAETKILGRT